MMLKMDGLKNMKLKIVSSLLKRSGNLSKKVPFNEMGTYIFDTLLKLFELLHYSTIIHFSKK